MLTDAAELAVDQLAFAVCTPARMRMPRSPTRSEISSPQMARAGPSSFSSATKRDSTTSSGTGIEWRSFKPSRSLGRCPVSDQPAIFPEGLNKPLPSQRGPRTSMNKRSRHLPAWGGSARSVDGKEGVNGSSPLEGFTRLAWLGRSLDSACPQGAPLGGRLGARASVSPAEHLRNWSQSDAPDAVGSPGIEALPRLASELARCHPGAE
jgi:hypothetical protein